MLTLKPVLAFVPLVQRLLQELVRSLSVLLHLPRFEVGYGGASEAVGVVFWKRRDERRQQTNRTICEPKPRRTSSLGSAGLILTPDRVLL